MSIETNHFVVNNPDIVGYTLVPILQPKGYIYTHAFILCSRCGGPVSHCGGPMHDAICMNCYNGMTTE
jgi:hypothetical protein